MKKPRASRLACVAPMLIAISPRSVSAEIATGGVTDAESAAPCTFWNWNWICYTESEEPIYHRCTAGVSPLCIF